MQTEGHVMPCLEKDRSANNLKVTNWAQKIVPNFGSQFLKNRLGHKNLKVKYGE